MTVSNWDEPHTACIPDGQFPLRNAPAGNRGYCNHHLGLEICLIMNVQLPAEDSLQAHLITGITIRMKYKTYFSSVRNLGGTPYVKTRQETD